MSEYLEEILNEAENSVSSSSTKTRVQTWNLFISFKGEISETNAQRIVKLIFRTLPIYQDRQSRTLIEQTILALSKDSEVFIKTLLTGLAKNTQTLVKETSSKGRDKDRLSLFRWYCFVLRSGYHFFNIPSKDKQKENEGAGKGLNLFSFIGLHLSLSSSVQTLEKPSQWKAIFRPLKENFLQFSGLYLEYVNTFFSIFKTSSSIPSSMIVNPSVPAGLLIQFYPKHSSDLPSDFKSQFVELYNKVILNSTTSHSRVEYLHYEKLISTLVTREDLNTQLMPSIDRNMKRNPEYILPSICFLFQCLSFSLSQVITSNPSLIETATNLLSSNSESIRTNSSNLMKVLSLKVVVEQPTLREILVKKMKENDQNQEYDVSNLKEDEAQSAYKAYSIILESLKKTFSSAKEVVHKVNVLTTIGVISELPNSFKLKHKLASQAINILVPLLSREGNEEVKLKGILSLSNWITFVEKDFVLDQNVTSFIEKGISDPKETVRCSIFSVLYTALCAGISRKSISGIVESMIKVSKAGMTQPTKRTDLIHSLVVLRKISLSDPELASRLEKEGFFSSILKNDSFLHSISFLEKASESTLLCITRILNSLFESPGESKGKEKEKEAPIQKKGGDKKGSTTTQSSVPTSVESVRDVLTHLLDSFNPSEQSVLSTIIFLLVNINTSVHKETAETVQNIIQLSLDHSTSVYLPQLNDSLMTQFHYFLMRQCKELEMNAEESSSSPKEGDNENASNKVKSNNLIKVQTHYRQALITLVHPSLSISFENLPQLFLTIHHPIFGTCYKKTKTVWNSVESNINNIITKYNQSNNNNNNTKNSISKLISNLNSFILSSDALFSKIPRLVESTLHLISLLPRHFASLTSSSTTSSIFRSGSIASYDVVFDLSQKLREHFEKLEKELDSLSEKDWKIYQSPLGEFITFEEESSGEYKPQVVERKPVKKLKGEKMYGEVDEEWAERTRKEIQAKKGGEKEKLTKEQQKEREKQIEQQDAIRNRISNLVSDVDHALVGLGVIWVHRDTNQNVSVGLSLVFYSFLKFIKFEFLVNRVCENILKIYSQTFENIFDSKLKVWLGLTVFRLSLELSSSQSKLSDSNHHHHHQIRPRHHKDLLVTKQTLNENVERVLSEVKGHILKPISISSFSLLIPLFEYAFISLEGGNAHENSMSLIEIHTKRTENRTTSSPFSYSLSSKEFPRTKLIKLLIKIIETQARFVQRSSASLTRVTENLGEQIELHSFVDSLISPHNQCRLSCLTSLQHAPFLVEGTILPDDLFATRIWICKNDVESSHTTIADELWDLYSHPLPDDFQDYYYPLLSSDDLNIRKMVGMGLATAAKAKSVNIETILSTLFKMFKDAMIKDEDLRYAKEDPQWVLRSGVVCALRGFSIILTEKELPSVFQFMITTGLGDLEEQVRDQMVDAGMEIINQTGKQYVHVILPILESYLANERLPTEQPSQQQSQQLTPEQILQQQIQSSAAYQEILIQKQDWTRKSVVILLACIAKHLDPSNEKIKDIIDKLLDALYTPAESVQRAVSTCLAPIVKNSKDEGERLIKLMLERLKNGKDYGARRGAAYGLAGIVKGMGIASLKQFGIMTTLQSYAEDKKHSSSRQGALLAYECLWHLLGRLFEPYVIHILPQLLNCFGDTIKEVRETTAETARAILGQLSEPGVKLFLPGVLKGLGDRAWRTKMKSIELLGSMAFCAPRQLSLFLPTIVPSLIEVLSDTHSDVQDAAKAALKDIGSVIRNPEIQVHVPIILKALDDPNAHTGKCLKDLLHTNFVHVIDAPSLALIMPILNRALRERISGSNASKRQAAQIVGSMCSLTAHKDLIPYLDVLIPQLKVLLTDPIPEIRGVAAKSLGSLVKGMGLQYFPDLIPYLMKEMQNDLGTVERSGSAQGLSDVLAGLDITIFEAKLTELLALTNHHQPNIREGALSFFVFCPSSFHEDLEPYLPRILPSVLRGLSDEVEMVRDISMKAAQSVVNEFAFSALELLLPALEDGLFSPNWRIRHSSIGLLGDMLHKISGTKSPSAPDSDGSMTGTQEQSEAIIKALGFERRNRILAALYIIRSDLNITVRQKSLAVWKSVVDNTPKTLKQMLPILSTMLIDCLGNDSEDAEKTQVGRRCMSDIVKKLGERILPEILPLLDKAYNNGGVRIKQGVCLGISELLSSSSRSHIVNYLEYIIPIIQKGLCAYREEVNKAAAEAFDVLCTCSMKSIEQILPPLLAQIGGPDSQTALQGLKQMLQFRAKVILPSLIPKLLEAPIEPEKARILSQLSSVCPNALHPHLPNIIVSMITAEKAFDTPEETSEYLQQIHGSLVEILEVVDDPQGVELISNEIIGLTKSSDSGLRELSAKLLGQYALAAKSLLDQEIFEAFFIALIALYMDTKESVTLSAIEAINNVSSVISKESQMLYISLLKIQLTGFYTQGIRKKEVSIPGFSLPKALSPILPFFLNGLVYSQQSSIKQESAEALGEIISMTSSIGLKPYINQIIGPLIRVVADKIVSSEVKEAILETLLILLDKSGSGLKGFASPLQTTLIKLLQEPSSSVRILSGRVLGKLIGLAKVEMIVNELLNQLNTCDGQLKETYKYALVCILFGLRKKLNDVTGTLPPAEALLLKIDESKLDRVEEVVGMSNSNMERIYEGKMVGLSANIKKKPSQVIEKWKNRFYDDVNEMNQSGSETNDVWERLHSSLLIVSYTLKYSTTEIDSKNLKNLSEWSLRYLRLLQKFEISKALCDILVYTVNHIYDMTGEVSTNPTSMMIMEGFAASLAGSDLDLRSKSNLVRSITRIANHINISTKDIIPVLSSALISQIKDAQRVNNQGYKNLLDQCLATLFNLRTSAYDFTNYLSSLDQTSSKFFTDYHKRFLGPNKTLPPEEVDSDRDEYGLLD